MNKIRIGILFGGRSGEHEVSLMSSKSVLSVLDPNKYEITEIGITHEGQWWSGENTWQKFQDGTLDGLSRVLLVPEPGQTILYRHQHKKIEALTELDVIFPVLHGTFGEDGTLQGFLEMADIAYVGAGVLGSSVGMDKALFKDVMRANDIPVVDCVIASRQHAEKDLQSDRRGEGLSLSILHQTSQPGFLSGHHQMQEPFRPDGRYPGSLPL
jgi:D-alanine-D-alanine ligase